MSQVPWVAADPQGLGLSFSQKAHGYTSWSIQLYRPCLQATLSQLQARLTDVICLPFSALVSKPLDTTVS